MSPETKEKRLKLSKLSKMLKPLVSSGEYDNINAALISVYSDNEELEFNTFKEWKNKGYQVNKGEKSFPVWGKPKSFKVDKSENVELKEYSFFPICNLFSNNQVELINN